MGPKKVSAKKKRMMYLDTKHKIIEKHEQGVRVVDLAKQYDRSASMICAILKQKKLIKAITPAKGVTIISKRRTSVHEEMEKLLLAWLMEKQLAGDTVTESIICEKARAIYGDLMRQTPGTSTDEASEESFKASRGWFDNFKKRTGIHSVVRHGHGQDSPKNSVFNTDFGERERVEMESEEPRSGTQSEVPESRGNDGPDFNSNVDHNGRNEPLKAIYCGATGMSLSRVILPPVKEEPQDECPAQHWESQWQTFLRTMECSHSQWTTPPSSKETAPWDDTRAFLASFERVAEACRWPKEEWTTRLLPALSGEAKEAFLNLEAGNREDYEKVKAAVLRGDAVIREKDRQRFRGLRCPEAKGLKEAYRQLQELCRRWLKVERRSKEEMLELVVLEQFLALLPTEVQNWVMGHYPETGSQAVDLAEDFLLRQRKPGREGDQMPQEVVVASSCSEADHLLSDEQRQLTIRMKEETEDEPTSMFEDSAPSISPLSPTKKEWGTPDDDEKCMPKISSVVGSYESSVWIMEENVTASFKEENTSPLLGIDGLKQKEWEPYIILSEKTDCEAAKKNVNASSRQEGEHAKEQREGFLPCPLENPVEKENEINAVEKLYVCSVCGKGFNRIKSLASHQRIHQEEKLCSYSKCGKGFCDQSGLTKHKWRHTEEKPYQCPVCKKSYKQKVRLITHRRIHTKETPDKHLGSGETFVPATSLVSNQKIHTGEKPYQCSFCRKSFGYKASLLSHQIIHTREKPHKCSDCSKSYLIQSSLMKHKRIHRG